MKFFQLVPSDTHIDFVGKFKLFAVGSGLMVAAALYLMFTKGFNFGVDFTGGSVIQVKFSAPKTAEEVRKLTHDVGEDDASVAVLGKENLEYLITVPLKGEKAGSGIEKKLIDKAGGPAAVKIVSVDVVGPKVGSELKAAALKSLLYSILLITIYIWFRFDARFAPGATFAMVHDIILAAGFYVLTGREFTITAVAALLTIAGYSVNDTIVIYDRVRELVKQGGQSMPLAETINRGINMTLSRTLLTSGVTFLSIIPIILFCSGEIRDFATAICVGIFVGTYSTIYVAAPLTIYAEKFFDRSGKKSLKTA